MMFKQLIAVIVILAIMLVLVFILSPYEEIEAEVRIEHPISSITIKKNRTLQ